MTVRIHEGKGNVPLWAAITLVVTILLGSSALIWGLVQRGSAAEYKANCDRIEMVSADVKDHSGRISALEISDAVTVRQIEDVSKSQAQIIEMLTKIGVAMGVK